MIKLQMVVLLSMVTLVLGAPPKPVPILSQENVMDLQSYRYSYESGDGTKVRQIGIATDDSEVVQGSFTFIAPDGRDFTVTYTADENGFVPNGQHLHPIPKAILKALEYNAAHPEEDNPRRL